MLNPPRWGCFDETVVYIDYTSVAKTFALVIDAWRCRDGSISRSQCYHGGISLIQNKGERATPKISYE